MANFMNDFKPLEKYSFHFEKETINGVFYSTYIEMPELVGSHLTNSEKVPFEDTKVNIQELQNIFILDDDTQIYRKDLSETVHPKYGKLINIEQLK